MSAPDVNVERQKTRHSTMVRGLWIGAAVAVVVTLGIFVYTSLSGEEASAVLTPATADSQ